ncbi:MAG: cell division protein FtsZ [Candidatus Hadarchaeales archaeon]
MAPEERKPGLIPEEVVPTPPGKLTFTEEELREILAKAQARIKIIGVGGAGCNTIARMTEVGITGAETIAVNTDAQDLLYTSADRKILIGKTVTGGLGAGNDPEKGRKAAEEDQELLKNAVYGAHMVFITCGLGGGTGTGAAPVIAELSRRMGILTSAVVTLPFTVEGKRRRENAMRGLEELKQGADSIVVIPNDRLLQISPDLSISEAFQKCDIILTNAVKGITESITKPGLINIDFADVKAVLSNAGISAICVAESDAENRDEDVVNQAINNPLLDVDVSNAKGALLNLIASNITIKEAQNIVSKFQELLNPEAQLIWGAQHSSEMKNAIRLVALLAGVYSPHAVPERKRPKPGEIDLGIKYV